MPKCFIGQKSKRNDLISTKRQKKDSWQRNWTYHEKTSHQAIWSSANSSPFWLISSVIMKAETPVLDLNNEILFILIISWWLCQTLSKVNFLSIYTLTSFDIKSVSINDSRCLVNHQFFEFSSVYHSTIWWTKTFSSIK
jgi:hypothetical protein